MEKEFLKLFGEVFYYGKVRGCGREKCRQLIHLADQVEPEIIHGNPKNGMIDISVMLALKERLS